MISFSLLPSVVSAESMIEGKDLKVAFIRDRNLWTYINGQEKQITFTGDVNPDLQWSYDGQWLLFQIEAPSENQGGQMQNEIWVYQPDTGKKLKVYYNGFSPQWAPNKHIVAFLDRQVLNISDLNQFYNVSLGVNSYTWLPDGSGFLLTSQANLLPSGWTNPVLYKRKLTDEYDHLLNNPVEQFFTVPKQLGEENSILSINANDFSFSPSNKWISFIVSPTASWSMDSNMLCVISSDGKKFEVLAEVIFGVGEPKWAPSKDIIAYIAGGGRIVYGFTNKKLNVKEFPVSGTLTPEDYAELDFTWVNDQRIVTSRVKEKEWSNDFTEHPLPALYSISINDHQQEKLTNPPDGFGDYHPTFIKAMDKLIWYRGKSITDDHRDIWIANTDGSEDKKWLEDVDEIEIYPN